MGTIQPSAGVWDGERESRLRELWDRGLSAGEIARELPFTRSAILGKVSRLKLPPRRSDNARAPQPAAPQKKEAAPRPVASRATPQQIVARATKIVDNVRRLRAERTAIVDADEPPRSNAVKLFDLRNETCRWPIGDPSSEDFFFCGDPTANLRDGRPYCPFHSLKAVDRTAIRDPKAFAKSALAAAR